LTALHRPSPSDGLPAQIPRLRPNRPFGSAIPAALSIEYVIKNKGEVTPTVVGRLSDVEQTYGVGSIRYCFAPIAVIGRVQSPRLLSDPKQTLAVGDSNRQIVWISDISRRRCYSAMIMLGSDNQGLEALWVRAA
jgi:hypothetical protein